jgi:hypothetical protein
MVESETKWFTRFESKRGEFKEGWVSESERGVFKERWFISSINRRRSSRWRRPNLCKTNSFLQVSGPARFLTYPHQKLEPDYKHGQKQIDRGSKLVWPWRARRIARTYAPVREPNYTASEQLFWDVNLNLYDILNWRMAMHRIWENKRNAISPNTEKSNID